MSQQPSSSDDPLSALAKAAEKSVHSEDAARAAGVKAREAAAAGRRRLVRASSFLALIAALATALVMQGPRVFDPYYGVDPLADPPQARAYVAGLLDGVLEWSAHHHGEVPVSLDQAVPQGRLPPAGSAYRVDYRVDAGVPVLTLEGGRAPLVVRGDGK